jgi:hypothetical protein
MEAKHNHLPGNILKLTQKIATKWNKLDSKLVKIEEKFKYEIEKYMELIWHF